ncbi:MAG: hypothetical protein FWG67_01165 [Defluviitaleaceae bacterium]|nr:hypothetical protein [Defluviitaleaceae bacterium]
MLKIEDLYGKYMNGNIEDRITKHLAESDPRFKKILEAYHDMLNQFEELLGEQASVQYDNASYQKLLLEEMKLTYAFKEGFLMATQISQEVAITQSQIQ